MGSNYWIKMYHEALHDPKMGRLSDHLWRKFFELCLIAGETDNDGYLPSVRDMAWTLRTTGGELESDLHLLSEYELVMLNGDRWIVSKFATRQAPVNARERKRMQRERDKKGRYYGHNAVTEDVTNCDTDVDVDVDKIVDVDVDVEATSSTTPSALDAYVKIRGGAVNPLDVDQVNDLADELEKHRNTLPAGVPGADLSGDDWVKAAVLTANAARKGGTISLNYIKAILDRWRAEGFKARRDGDGSMTTTKDGRTIIKVQP